MKLASLSYKLPIVSVKAPGLTLTTIVPLDISVDGVNLALYVLPEPLKLLIVPRLFNTTISLLVNVAPQISFVDSNVKSIPEMFVVELLF